MIAMMRSYEWAHVVMLTSIDDVYLASGLKLTKQLGESGIEVLRPAAFEPGGFSMPVEIKRSGFRTIIIMAYSNDTRAAALSSELEGMISGYGWITTDERPQTVLQMQGWLYVRPLLPSEGMQAFAEQVRDYSKSHFESEISADSVDLIYSAALYNAVLL